MEADDATARVLALDVGAIMLGFFVFDAVLRALGGAAARELVSGEPRWSYWTSCATQLVFLPAAAWLSIRSCGCAPLAWLGRPYARASRLELLPLTLFDAYVCKDLAYTLLLPAGFLDATMVAHHVVCLGVIVSAGLGALGHPPNVYTAGFIAMELGSLVRGLVVLFPRGWLARTRLTLALMAASNVLGLAAAAVAVFLPPLDGAGLAMRCVCRWGPLTVIAPLSAARQLIAHSDYGRRQAARREGGRRAKKAA